MPFFTYSIGIVYSTKLESPHSYPYSWVINKGFHSYREPCHMRLIFEGWDSTITIKYPTKNVFIDYFKRPSSCLGIMSCIIPKGSKYYENEDGEIVSDTIKPIYCYEVINKILNYG